MAALTIVPIAFTTLESSLVIIFSVILVTALAKAPDGSALMTLYFEPLEASNGITTVTSCPLSANASKTGVKVILTDLVASGM